MDSDAVRKRTRIRSIAALTANSVNGVLIRDVASVLIREEMTGSQTITPDHYVNIKKASL